MTLHYLSVPGDFALRVSVTSAVASAKLSVPYLKYLMFHH